MTTWALFLDDQADDPDATFRWPPEGYKVARSCAEAIFLVEAFGPPGMMSLDHDLGDGRDAMPFLRWLSTVAEEPPEFRVHSANPVGRENIIAFMGSWKRSLSL